MALRIDGQEILTLKIDGTKVETLKIDGIVVARKPTITTQPKSGTITDAQTYTLSVVADGLGSTMGYQWRKADGTAVSGATGTSYTFTPSSTGTFQFYCDVSGFGGATKTNTATITVEASSVAPTITKDPVGGTMVEGQPFTASIAVDWGGETGSIVWYLDGIAQSESNSTSFTFYGLDVGTHHVKAKATNSKGSDTSSEAQVTTLSALISETVFDSDTTYILDSDCARIEAQGCGGGGGGGCGANVSSVLNGGAGGGGGGGASILEILSSSATASGTITVKIGSGGLGATVLNENGGDGGESSISGAGTSNLIWSGGYGGSSPAKSELKGGQGGNASTGVGGGQGGQSWKEDGASGISGGGGGGGAGDSMGSNSGGDGGDGGGTNGGAGATNTGNMNGVGGGGGSNDGSWWNSADSGKGGNGGVYNVNPTDATGYGNGGGGSSAVGEASILPASNGSGGYIIIRQYRA